MLTSRIIAVQPAEDYTLILTFTNQEVRLFDVKPYLDRGIFRELKDPGAFHSVRPVLGSIQWRGGQDFCPDMLYEQSAPLAEATPPAEASETTK